MTWKKAPCATQLHQINSVDELTANCYWEMCMHGELRVESVTIAVNRLEIKK